MLNKKRGVLRVVGIGASAGGLDALAHLLPKLKPNANTVYIIALHMARDNHTDLVLKLLKRLSALPLATAIHNDQLVADHVFLIPPGVTGIIQQGRIQLLPIASDQISSPSVNALFKSIAHDANERGVGIILSGAGADGMIGCRAIKTAGGKIIAQNIASSQMAGMPESVIRAGLVDEILLPAEIAQLLNNEIYFSQVNIGKGQSHLMLNLNDTEIFKQLLKAILATTEIDFSNYKEETLLRRLNRRMSMLKITSLLDYQTYTQKHPDELHKLQHQFLVSLSCFFRDSESFSIAKQHINELMKNKFSANSIRIWVPGCASGEECYSWAILLAEILGNRFTVSDIHIHGSDLNEQAITLAEQGWYSQAALRNVSQDILDRYFDNNRQNFDNNGQNFDNNGQHFQVKPYIRQVCHFHRENVINSCLLEKVDAISCRNLLIYMKSELQDQLIKKFYDCLNPDGLLFLGQSETIGLIGNTLFVPLDHYHRVYCRKKIKTK